VIVNRIWLHHFGEGIVRTPNNFGARGEFPTHPELLAYLAARFIETGWSVKALHRQIMNTAVYQQRSQFSPAAHAKDPENRLLWRMPRQRLEAEAIRDALLAVGGRIDARLDGTGFEDLANPRRSLYLMTARSKHSPKGWIGRELIWRRLGGCSIAEHYECFACGTDFS
jgi:hypothetical protein